MDERAMQFRVGIVVLATVLIAITLFVLVGAFPDIGVGRGVYSLAIEFREAPGIAVGSPVRKSGILIGRVEDVRFDDDDGTIVDVAIYDDIRLSKRDRARIKGTLLGDGVIEFVRGPGPKIDEYYADGDRVPSGQVAGDPLQTLSDLQGDIQGALTAFQSAGQDVSKLAGSVDRLISENDQQIGDVLKQAKSSLASFEEAMNNINVVLGDKKTQEDLRNSFQQMPELLAKTDATITELQKAVKSAGDNLDNLKGFTGKLNERGDELITNIENSTKNLNSLLIEMKQFGSALNDREGSLGQLIHNPDLYQNLNRAVQNVESATQQLRPIMDNARVFSEILAREPGFILRNAVNRRPWGKGYAPALGEEARWNLAPQESEPLFWESRRPSTTAPRQGLLRSKTSRPAESPPATAIPGNSRLRR